MLDNEELEIVCLMGVAQFYATNPQVHLVTLSRDCHVTGGGRVRSIV